MQLEFEVRKDKEYEVNSIWDSAVYAKESTTGQLPGLYYLVLWKGYPEEENIWKPVLVILHLQRLVNAYHKDNPEKPTAISLSIDTAPPMARPTQGRLARFTAVSTKKRGQPVDSTTTNKLAKKS